MTPRRDTLKMILHLQIWKSTHLTCALRRNLTTLLMPFLLKRRSDWIFLEKNQLRIAQALKWTRVKWEVLADKPLKKIQLKTMAVRGKEGSAGGLEDQKVKVEVVGDLNKEKIVDNNLLERFPHLEHLVNTWKASKEKELKQELLVHSEHSLETQTTQITSRQNRKRKRYRVNSWRRTKRTKVVTIKSEDPSSLVEDKSVEDKHSIGIELNPFHDDTNTEKAIKTENQSNTNIIKTSQAGNETITPAPKKVKVKSLPLATRRSTRGSARAAQVLFVELCGKI